MFLVDQETETQAQPWFERENNIHEYYLEEAELNLGSVTDAIDITPVPRHSLVMP